MNLAQRVGEYILQYAEEHWKDCIDEDGSILWDEDAAIIRALEALIYDFADELQHDPVLRQYFKEARNTVREAAEDTKAYGTTMADHMRYHGLKESDF